jgi:hypothetical protein
MPRLASARRPILAAPQEFLRQQSAEPHRARWSEVKMILEIAFLADPSARVDVDGARALHRQPILHPIVLPCRLIVESG